MINLEGLYFKWLTDIFEESFPELDRLAAMMHVNVFERRVGRDVNLAIDGEALRTFFLDEYAALDIDPSASNGFLTEPCSWLEMLIALSRHLDFLYDEGVQFHFTQIVSNLGLGYILDRRDKRFDRIDQQAVDDVCERIDRNQFGPDGEGGLFPLEKHDHPDQRGVEIWEQQAAYFRERLEGVLWTFTE